MTVATLRNWERLAEAEEAEYRPPGRPRHTEAARRRARTRVRAELERQGWSAGEGSVFEALRGEVPRRLVRSELAALKRAHRVREARARREVRRSVTVQARDAVWSMDATHIGGDERGKVEAEVVREVASGRTLAIGLGPPATGRAVAKLLEVARRERGGAPLVLVSDNGAAYKSRAVGSWLARHRVVHLRSLPRTPQHNPWSEHGNAELKRETGLGKGVRVRCAWTALRGLVKAVERLDHARPRRSRGWLTAAQYDAALPPATRLVGRKRFYAACCCAIRKAVLDCDSPRERRRAERNAILKALERFGLINMTGGGAPCSRPKTSRVS